MVELIELLLTLNLIDEMTDTRGKRSCECLAQGTANTVTGLFGGMVESSSAEDPHDHLADDRLG
jgi:MFS superfamily sulfate permease-like transporter